MLQSEYPDTPTIQLLTQRRHELAEASDTYPMARAMQLQRQGLPDMTGKPGVGAARRQTERGEDSVAALPLRPQVRSNAP